MEEQQYIFKRYQTRPATVRVVKVPGNAEDLSRIAAERGTAFVHPGEWVFMDEDSHELDWMTDAEFKSQYSEASE